MANNANHQFGPVNPNAIRSEVVDSDSSNGLEAYKSYYRAYRTPVQRKIDKERVRALANNTLISQTADGTSMAAEQYFAPSMTRPVKTFDSEGNVTGLDVTGGWVNTAAARMLVKKWDYDEQCRLGLIQNIADNLPEGADPSVAFMHLGRVPTAILAQLSQAA